MPSRLRLARITPDGATRRVSLHDPGVRTVVIPRKGSPGKTRQALDHRAAFRKAVEWRAGSKGRISSLTVSTAPGCVRGLSGACCPQGC